MINKLVKTYIGSTIPIINVSGPITSTLTQKVTKRLKNVGTSQAVALAVVVNSPGGLPVQSQIISQRLQNFAIKKNLKLYTFAKDIAASGGYFILSSGNHVVADSSSIVGSIGVVFQKLKVKGLLDHLNVDHKHYATNDKLLQSILSPYQEISNANQQYLKTLCSNSHQRFIQYVKKQRGNKLKNDPSNFSGQIFTGQQALERGLIDEVGSIIQVLEARHPGAKLEVQPQSRTFVQRVLNL